MGRARHRHQAFCLLSLSFQGILQKEPNFLATLFRQKIILIIVGLR